MKKLMIAAAVAVLGIAANAAAVGWEDISGQAYDHTGAAITDGSLYAYLLLDSVAVAGGTTYSYNTAMANVKAGNFDFVADANVGDGGAVALYGYDMGSSADVLAGNNTVSAYLVLLDSDTPGDAVYGYISEKITVTTDATGNIVTGGDDNGMMGFDFAGTANAGNWYTAPEPTSGLLLLIGMAGLALRRRRA